MKNNPKFLFDQWMHAQNAIGNPLVVAIHEQLYPSNAASKPGQQVIDHNLYAVKSVSGQSSFDDLFKTDDAAAVGITNVSNAQLPPNTFFMLTAVTLQYAVAGGTTASDLKGADFKTPLPVAVINGETSIAIDKKPILDKILNEVFATSAEYAATGDTNAAAGTAVTYTMRAGGLAGYYELDNPKMITPQTIIEVKEKFAAALTTNAALRIIFHGAVNATA